MVLVRLLATSTALPLARFGTMLVLHSRSATMSLRHFALTIALIVTATLAAVPAQEPPRVSPSLFAEMRWRSIGPHRASRTVAAAGHRRQPYRFYTAAAGRRRRARPARSGRSRANRSFRLEVVSFIARTTVIAGCANIGRHVPWMMPSGSWWQFWARENC